MSARRQGSGSRSESLLQGLSNGGPQKKQSQAALLSCWGSSFQGVSGTSASVGKSLRSQCMRRRGNDCVLEQSSAQPAVCLLWVFLATAHSTLQSCLQMFVQAACAGRACCVCKGKDKSYFVLRAIVKQPQLHNEGGDAQCKRHLIPRWASEQAAAFVLFRLSSLASCAN